MPANIDIHADVNPPLIEIRPVGRLLVSVRPDGSIEYGDDYEPDEAARVFWEAIAERGIRYWEPLARAAGWRPPLEG